MPKTKTSIIGLGAMGAGMAKNILRAGIPLTGYDLSAAASAQFCAMGGHAATSAADAAADAKLLIIMVVDAEQVFAVLTGEDGALSALPDSATVMLCSTIAPSEVRALSEVVHASGALLLDAPVSGGKSGADAGTLTVMASGPDEAFAATQEVLDAVSKKVHRLGAVPGIGATYKIVHQLAAGVHLVAAAELMAFGARAGCDPQTLFDIVSDSAGQSWMFDDRVPRILDGDFSPRSMINIMRKDLSLVLQEGGALSVPLPLATAAQQTLLSAISMGLGEMDDSAVVKVYERITGHSVKRDDAD